MPIARQAGWDEVKTFAQAAAQHMASTLPDRFSAKMGEQNRRGRIFIDYLRNNRGSSTVVAYSPRARPGMGVSVPLAPVTTATLGKGERGGMSSLFLTGSTGVALP